MNTQNAIFGREFCDYESIQSIGKCGLWCEDKSGRCAKHKNKKSENIRKPTIRLSGDSKYRQENGQFQAKEGR